MSLNNVLPAWIFELDEILIRCEGCRPEDRHAIYVQAYLDLHESKSIPEQAKRKWMEKIKYGFVWDLPRKMQ